MNTFALGLGYLVLGVCALLMAAAAVAGALAALHEDQARRGIPADLRPQAARCRRCGAALEQGGDCTTCRAYPPPTFTPVSGLERMRQDFVADARDRDRRVIEQLFAEAGMPREVAR